MLTKIWPRKCQVLIDNIFDMFGCFFFLQKVDILIGINYACARVLTDLFVYSYKADFMHGLLKKNEKKYASQVF